MASEPANLVLEYLRRIDSRLDSIEVARSRLRILPLTRS
jgi:hypothetical protein